MGSTKKSELLNLSVEELQSELQSTQESYRKLRFDHGIQGVENPLMIREMRREIARIKTEVRRREVEAMSSEELAKRDKIRFRRRSK